MKTTELVVTKCKDCPFSNVEYGRQGGLDHECLAPVQVHESQYDIDKYYPNNTSPAWCPLKKTDLLITFKK